LSQRWPSFFVPGVIEHLHVELRFPTLPVFLFPFDYQDTRAVASTKLVGSPLFGDCFAHNSCWDVSPPRQAIYPSFHPLKETGAPEGALRKTSTWLPLIWKCFFSDPGLIFGWVWTRPIDLIRVPRTGVLLFPPFLPGNYSGLPPNLPWPGLGNLPPLFFYFFFSLCFLIFRPGPSSLFIVFMVWYSLYRLLPFYPGACALPTHPLFAFEGSLSTFPPAISPFFAGVPSNSGGSFTAPTHCGPMAILGAFPFRRPLASRLRALTVFLEIIVCSLDWRLLFALSPSSVKFLCSFLHL